MFYDARQVANWFIKRARRDGREVPPVGIMKLAYFAQGRCLAKHGKPLFPNGIQVWRIGAIIADICNVLDVGEAKMPRSLNVPDVTEPQTVALLEEVWNEYGGRHPYELTRLIRAPGGPWDIARRAGGWYSWIPADLIKLHHEASIAHVQH